MAPLSIQCRRNRTTTKDLSKTDRSWRQVEYVMSRTIFYLRADPPIGYNAPERVRRNMPVGRYVCDASMSHSIQRRNPRMSTHSFQGNRAHRDLHFDLRWCGPTHTTEDYTLHVGGRSHRLARHTPDTLAACSVTGTPTHFAMQVAVQTDAPQFIYVTVPPKVPNGFPT